MSINPRRYRCLLLLLALVSPFPSPTGGNPPPPLGDVFLSVSLFLPTRRHPGKKIFDLDLDLAGDTPRSFARSLALSSPSPPSPISHFDVPCSSSLDYSTCRNRTEDFMRNKRHRNKSNISLKRRQNMKRNVSRVSWHGDFGVYSALWKLTGVLLFLLRSRTAIRFRRNSFIRDYLFNSFISGFGSSCYPASAVTLTILILSSFSPFSRRFDERPEGGGLPE